MQPMRSACARQRHALECGLCSIDASAFFDLLTSPSMLGEVKSHLPAPRERLLPPTETLAMFLAQALRGSILPARGGFLYRAVKTSHLSIVFV